MGNPRDHDLLRGDTMVIKNSKGQAVVESVLLLVVFMAVTTAVVRGFRESEVIESFISKPWKILSGMIESGVWAPERQARSQHPVNRRLTVKDDRPEANR